MRNLSNTTGSFGYGETSWEDGSITEFTSDKKSRKSLIQKANAVSIKKILKHYGLRTNHSDKMICPFPSHKGGKERTPSFKIYSQDNSFHCFGCNSGTYCTDFVAKMENISTTDAARSILTIFDSDVVVEFDRKVNHHEELEVMMKFSDAVRDFYGKFQDEQSIKFIEEMCRIYDLIHIKHKFSDVQSLKRFTDECLIRIKRYIACLM